MGTSDLPEMYARGRSPSASVYITSTHVTTNIFHLGTHLQVWKIAGMLRECIYMGPCEFSAYNRPQN